MNENYLISSNILIKRNCIVIVNINDKRLRRSKMEINYMTIVFNWLNIAIWIAIIVGIIKGIKEIKKFINRTKEMDKKLDTILNQLKKKDNE